MSANNGATASRVIADLCGDPLITEEVSAKLKSSKVRDCIEYIYAISHNVAQKAREGKEVDVLDVLTRIEFFAKEAMETPLRNCDVGTPYEQVNRMRQFCAKQKRNGIINCGYCPIKHQYERDCTLAWAQMPYEADDKKKGADNE